MSGGVRAERGKDGSVIIGLAVGGGRVRTSLIPLGFTCGGIIHRIIHKQRLHDLFIMDFSRFHALDTIEVRFQRGIDGAHGAVVAVT